jgi:hypothetical protein
MVMPVLISLLAGVIMGLGLAISGMINPAKVLNFLDFAGDWDPTLVVVMASALITTTVGYRLVFSRERPLFAAEYLLPTRSPLRNRVGACRVLPGTGDRRYDVATCRTVRVRRCHGCRHGDHETLHP